MRGSMLAFDGRSGQARTAVGAVDFSASEASAIVLSLPPGRWLLQAKGFADWSVGTANAYWCGAYLRSGSGTGPVLDASSMAYMTIVGQIPFALLADVTFAATTTVLLRGAPSHAGVGLQQLLQCVLTATPIR